MKSEDVFVIRALLWRMKLEAKNPYIDRMSDEILSLVSGAAPMPTLEQPQIQWVGETMVVG